MKHIKLFEQFKEKDPFGEEESWWDEESPFDENIERMYIFTTDHNANRLYFIGRMNGKNIVFFNKNGFSLSVLGENGWKIKEKKHLNDEDKIIIYDIHNKFVGGFNDGRYVFGWKEYLYKDLPKEIKDLLI